MPPVLVLGYDFRPIDIVDTERAITLWYEGKTETVEVYLGQFLHSPSVTIEAPAVIRFVTTGKKKRQVVRFSREAVYDRDHGSCQYCGTAVPYAKMTYDHVIPRSLGGETCWTNVVVACSTCNTRKGGRTPEQAGMRLRAVPVKPKKLSHALRRNRFVWRDMYPKEWEGYLEH